PRSSAPSSSPCQLLSRVDVPRVGEVPHLDLPYPRAGEQIPKAAVPAQLVRARSEARSSTGWLGTPSYVARTASSSPSAAATASIAAGVTPGWSPSTTSTASAPSNAARPQRSEADCPSAQSAQ